LAVSAVDGYKEAAPTELTKHDFDEITEFFLNSTAWCGGVAVARRLRGACFGKQGDVRAVGRGVTGIMVRYSGQVAAARIAVPFGGTESAEDESPAGHWIDKQIDAELKRLRLPRSPLSSDAEFLRRVPHALTDTAEGQPLSNPMRAKRADLQVLTFVYRPMDRDAGE
jgi:hypothetical protein